jgi:hypothetical protein
MCSVRGLYRAFPPSDPPVYIRPQLKPSHGICSFTTTTFGVHRGADQGAGRSTSGRELHHLLGGSTSASPPSTAGLLQPPGLTSTRPGRHTAVPNLHRHLWADTQFHPAGIFYVPIDIFYVPASIFMSRPAYMGLGSTSAFPGPAYNSPGQNIAFPGQKNSRSRAGMQQIRPLLAGIAGFRADPGQFRLGQCSRILAGATESRLGRQWENPGWAGALRPRLGRIFPFPAGPGQANPSVDRHLSGGRAGTLRFPTPFLRAGAPPFPPRPACTAPGWASVLGRHPSSPRVLLHLVAGPRSRYGSTPGRLPQRARPPLCDLAPVATRPALAGQIRLILFRLCQQFVQVSIIIKLYCA